LILLIDVVLQNSTPYRTSILGFGASALGSMWENIDEEEGIRSVHDAFNAGVNLFDTAPHYGNRRSERLLGRALDTLPVPVVTGGIPLTPQQNRSRYILSTKVSRCHTTTCIFYLMLICPTGSFQVGRLGEHFDHSREAIKRSLDESLALLRTDYVDLLIAHDIGMTIHTLRYSNVD
jgi:L-galactose dehydrogenase